MRPRWPDFVGNLFFKALSPQIAQRLLSASAAASQSSFGSWYNGDIGNAHRGEIECPASMALRTSSSR
jgi:hypothetical protein